MKSSFFNFVLSLNYFLSVICSHVVKLHCWCWKQISIMKHKISTVYVSLYKTSCMP